MAGRSSIKVQRGSRRKKRNGRRENGPKPVTYWLGVGVMAAGLGAAIGAAPGVASASPADSPDSSRGSSVSSSAGPSRSESSKADKTDKTDKADKADKPVAEKPKSDKPAVEKVAAASGGGGGEGTLMISSKPPCEILIDGKPTGLTTPQRAITLPAGAHKVTLVNTAEGIKKTVSVQITADKPTKVIQDLMK